MKRLALVTLLLLGGAVPESARGTTDSTYYTHYSLLSTVEANWGLGSLGRGDTNKYVSRSLSLHSHARLTESSHVPQDPLERLLLRGVIGTPGRHVLPWPHAEDALAPRRHHHARLARAERHNAKARDRRDHDSFVSARGND